MIMLSLAVYLIAMIGIFFLINELIEQKRSRLYWDMRDHFSERLFVSFLTTKKYNNHEEIYF